MHNRFCSLASCLLGCILIGYLQREDGLSFQESKQVHSRDAIDAYLTSLLCSECIVPWTTAYKRTCASTTGCNYIRDTPDRESDIGHLTTGLSIGIWMLDYRDIEIFDYRDIGYRNVFCRRNLYAPALVTRRNASEARKPGPKRSSPKTNRTGNIGP